MENACYVKNYSWISNSFEPKEPLRPAPAYLLIPFLRQLFDVSLYALCVTPQEDAIPLAAEIGSGTGV